MDGRYLRCEEVEWQDLSELRRSEHGAPRDQETLHRVSELTIQAVPGRTLQASAQAHYETGEGPCLDAFEQQAVFMIESTNGGGPWPAFRQAAAAHGIGSTLSLPMVVDKNVVGAMNLYAHEERAFDARAAL